MTEKNNHAAAADTALRAEISGYVDGLAALFGVERREAVIRTARVLQDQEVRDAFERRAAELYEDDDLMFADLPDLPYPEEP
jgi:hypothetical protein